MSDKIQAPNPFIFDESDVYHRMNNGFLNNKNFCSIGKVVAINSSPVSVDVQPLIKYFDQVASWQDATVLQQVPVAQMQNNLYSIKTPLNVGDTGIILSCDREIYTCLVAGAQTTTTPDSGDFNNPNDCIFIPSVQAFALSNTIKQSGVEFVSNETELIQELLTLIQDLTVFATAVAAAPTDTLVNYGTTVASACTSLITSLALVTTKLTAFKGLQ